MQISNEIKIASVHKGSMLTFFLISSPLQLQIQSDFLKYSEVYVFRDVICISLIDVKM